MTELTTVVTDSSGPQGRHVRQSGQTPPPGPQQRTGGQLWAKGTQGRGGWGQALMQHLSRSLMQSWWCGQSPRGSGARPRGVARAACGFQGPFWPRRRNQEREKVLGLLSQERLRAVSGRTCAGSGSRGREGRPGRGPRALSPRGRPAPHTVAQTPSPARGPLTRIQGTLLQASAQLGQP